MTPNACAARADTTACRHPHTAHLAWLALALLGFAGPQPARAQTRLERPPLSRPTVVVGPAHLSARSPSTARVSLVWPAVAGAEKYRVTRIANTGDAEITIAELPASSFALYRSRCAVGGGDPSCLFEDVTTQRPPGTVQPAEKTIPTSGALTEAPPSFPHTVVSGQLYTYRVWAILPGPIVSPPSPPATVRVQ